MLQRSLVVVSCLALLAACGGDDDPTGPGSGASGSMSFTYTGGGGGTYNVSGVMPTIQANIGNNDWAAGNVDTPNTMVGVGGVRHRNAQNRYDFAVLGINRLTVGTSQVDANCDPDTENCSGMVLLIDVSEADNNFDFICTLGTGSLAITSISSSRVQGTFSGSGACVSSSLATSAFTVTGGTFDVPLVANLPQ